MRNPKALFVLTSHDDLNGLRPTGFYINEAAHPWKVLTTAGFAVDFASVKGGPAPQDGRNEADDEQNAFLQNEEVASQLQNTKTVSECDVADYDVVLYVGGHGTMFDFPSADAIAAFSSKLYENGGIVAAVCHGPAGIVNVKLSDGSYLVAGKKVTGFTNSEEDAVGLVDTVPFLLETELTDRGAEFVGAPDFTDNVIVDGRLITGQNPQSAASLADAIVRTFNEK